LNVDMKRVFISRVSSWSIIARLEGLTAMQGKVEVMPVIF
jgi:hypothetical protein